MLRVLLLTILPLLFLGVACGTNTPKDPPLHCLDDDSYLAMSFDIDRGHKRIIFDTDMWLVQDWHELDRYVGETDVYLNFLDRGRSILRSQKLAPKGFVIVDGETPEDFDPEDVVNAHFHYVRLQPDYKWLEFTRTLDSGQPVPIDIHWLQEGAEPYPLEDARVDKIGDRIDLEELICADSVPPAEGEDLRP